MSNYKETTETGTAWRRARQVLIKNDYDSPQKTIIFTEEDIVSIGDRVIKTDAGMLVATYAPENLISLRDPNTGEKTGNVILQSLVYQALYSLYLETAENRDQNISPVQIVITPP